MKYLILAFTSLSLICQFSVFGQSEIADQLLSEKYAADKPGAVALIAQNGEVLFNKAYGLANLELGVPMNTSNVFKIGSITKQFTAVSILMLMEQGKLALTDDITKYIADYPTHGHEITIHHLLNHTSGIKSYTSMPSFKTEARTDMSPQELIDVFKNEPIDFEPGEQWSYNNSAYIILGHIIEVASGLSYAEYVEQHIFKPLGMNNSYYGSHSKIIPNRASGYQPDENGYRNADYLSMTLPYAAGSLMSCVDDLLKWQQAIHRDKLISTDSKALAFTDTKLNDGSSTYYGYGWSVDEIAGTPTIEHGGGIFGYTCNAVYVPSADLYAVVLTNSNGNSPTDITVELAAQYLGTPMMTKEPIELPKESHTQWVGTYEFPDGVYRFITYEEGSLFSQREGSEKLRIFSTAPNSYQFEDSFTSYQFTIEDGMKTALFESRIRKSKGLESDKEAPAERIAIELSEEILNLYVGTYELQPGFDIAFRVREGKLYTQATGQPEFEVFAESETKFFLKVVNAQVEFTIGDQGVAESMTLYQGGAVMPAKRKS